jgi:hypothetical protein
MPVKTALRARPATAALPAPILASDLIQPHWKAKGRNKWATNGPYNYLRFDLWHTERFGWCIPTLQIRHATARHVRAGATQDRTYAVAIDTGSVVRIGLGPHVTATHTVYVTEGRRAVLQPLIDLRSQGEGDAGDIRDRISTRRAQSAMRRFY